MSKNSEKHLSELISSTIAETREYWRELWVRLPNFIPYYIDEACPVIAWACVDQGCLIFSPECSRYSVEALQFVVAHEIWHLVDPSRKKWILLRKRFERNPSKQLWREIKMANFQNEYRADAFAAKIERIRKYTQSGYELMIDDDHYSKFHMRKHLALHWSKDSPNNSVRINPSEDQRLRRIRKILLDN